jgi:hypothetical protein
MRRNWDTPFGFGFDQELDGNTKWMVELGTYRTVVSLGHDADVF